MDELDVINEMLATMGEAPLNQIDEDHPYVAAGRRFLASTNRKVQAYGWWFNTEYPNVVPDPTSGFIYLPEDVISAESIRGLCYNRYTQRGRRLYDITNGTFEITESPVYLKIIREVPYEEVPPTAQDAIAQNAVLRFQKNYDADPQKTAEQNADAADAMIILKSENTRQMKVNFINRTTAGAKVAAVTPYGSMRLPYPGIGVK